MLEIRNLTKIYKTKGGADVTALDNVSLSFKETGLVFLLGKSGSGKSTLLNLAGGLDEPTSGEVVVMGRSSRDFTGSDFDSYRNTFIGFIFQEYNVLNEFSVEDNVALALELQGKPKDRQKISEILRAVELENFAKRKPNTLSGGQKQRIAIARALIKDPQIIMADEPTGALDSATGKQVFDTLKKLAETRLVIVVSHDREFAEIYGDRIIELKDGKVISDETKKKLTPVQVDDSVTAIGENTLSVKCGKELTEESLKKIESFIRESEGDLILTRGEQEVQEFRRATRTDDTGGREHFVKTQPEDVRLKPYRGDETKFIRSKLPAVKALKIGASGLKLKPFRLILTIFLSLVAFVMFGLFSTMMFYDGNEVLVNSFMQSDANYLVLQKNYRIRVTYQDDYQNTYVYYTDRNTRFTPAEVQTYQTQFGSAVGAYSLNLSPANAAAKLEYKNYYLPSFSLIASPDASLRKKIIAGTFPVGKEQIAVSSYFLECMQNGTFKRVTQQGKTGEEKQIRTANDLIGERLLFNVGGEKLTFEISGVFDTGEISNKYAGLKEGSPDNWILEFTYPDYLIEQMHTAAWVSDEFIAAYGPLFQSMTEDYQSHFDYGNNALCIANGIIPDSIFFSSYGIKVYDGTDKSQLDVTFFRDQKTALADKELIVPLHSLSLPFDIFYPDYENLSADEQINSHDDFEKYCLALPVVIERRVQTVTEYDEHGNPVEFGERDATQEEITAAENFIKSYLNEHWNQKVSTFWQSFNTVGTPQYIEEGEYTVVGYYNAKEDGFYCSANTYANADIRGTETQETKYEPEPDATFSYVFIEFEKDADSFGKLVQTLGSEHINPDNDVYYYLYSTLYSSVMTANDMVDTLSTAFLWVGIILAVFASLLLFNFISMSISNKKKEIGILRAVGARGLDVFKIFFSESGIIVGICLLLSLIGTVVLTGVINGVLKAEAGLDVTLFVFGWASVALMVGVALFVALVATFLPVYLAARKKPVESIRAL